MVVENDHALLGWDLSERCIAARLAMYLQNLFPEYSVDVEYNRVGYAPKTLDLPEECANRKSRNGEPLVLPDIIVHKRGPEGPNLLVLELKKTTNPTPRDCDQLRLRAFRERLKYSFGALIECETRRHHVPTMTMVEWLG
jgi:hypothetical protein